MKNLLGFRQFLRSESSYKDLLHIIEGQTKYFSPDDGFCTVIALCGDNPREFLEENELMNKTAFYNFSAWEESAHRVAQVYFKSCFKKERVQIIHFNENDPIRGD